MRRLAILIALALAGCGGSAPSSVVPADASIYVGMSAAEAERLPALTSREVDFEREIRPWLGDRAAYFARADDEYGLVFAADDEDDAEAFGRRIAAAGPLRASAVIDGYLVLASSRELLRAANAAAGGQALSDSTRLDVAGEDEDDAPAILLATEGDTAFDRGLELFDVLPDEPGLALEGDGALTARVWRGLVEIKGLPARGPAPSLANLPGDARVAIAAPDVSQGDPLARGREELEKARRWPEPDLAPLLRHAGAGTMVVQGEAALIGARIDAEVTDEAALEEEVRALARRLPRRRYHVDLTELDGALRLLASPRVKRLPHFVVTAGERLVIETGEIVGGVAEDLGDTRRYREAERRLGGPPSLLVDDLAARDDGRGTLRISRGGG